MDDLPTRDEVRAAYEAAMAVALAMTRSKERSREIVQDAFERILTTRPWSRAERTFAEHAMNTVRSLVLHARVSKAGAHEKEVRADFQRDEVGHSAVSPEEKTLHRSEEEGRQSDAEEELDALANALAENAVARDVLRCRREHGLVKAGEIAAKLGIAVDQVYRANETLKERLRTLRKKPRKDEE